MEIEFQHNKPEMSSTVRHRYICARIGPLINDDTGLSIKTIACALIAALIGIAHVKGQDSGKPPLYGHGFFPPGQLYVEGGLQNLIGKTFAEPTYLAGSFVYLGNIQGKETFSTYTQGLLKDGSIAFGRILIQVKFYDNRPPGLTIGKVIVATPTEPLTLKSVKLANDGYLIVQAESWSAP
jgi:hypothetical protein